MQAGNYRRSGFCLPSKDPQHIQLVLGVEVICRFVKQVDCRCLCQRLSNCKSAPLATRQSADIAVRNISQVHLVQGLLRDTPVLFRFPLQPANMRVSPYQHGVENRCREDILGILRQQRQVLGDVLAPR